MSSSSPRGYLSEIIVKYAFTSTDTFGLNKLSVNSNEVSYVQWLFPGIIAMNMMFSALFGVGFILVRYRKNGVLKRFSISPLRSYEFLTAQIISRLCIILVTTILVYACIAFIYGFRCKGSYLLLLLFFAVGAFSMISMGLLIAARSSSEEFTDGIMNLITWPLMFLSEVWFSLEGAKDWVKTASRFSPLTYLTEGARMIINDGADFNDVKFHLLIMGAMSLVFLTAGSILFKWNKS